MIKRYSPIQILGSSVLVLGSLLFAACGGEEPMGCPDFSPAPDITATAQDSIALGCEPVQADPVTAIVTPAQMFTGYNGGQNQYRAVVVTNFGDLILTSSDELVATAAPQGCVTQGGFGISGVVTTTGPGTATITVESGAFTRNIPVTVTEYSPADYALGEARYNNPANPGEGRMGCAECHSQAGGAPHDPLALGGLTDAELIAATTQGKYPDKCVLPTGISCNCTPSGTDSATACAACGDPSCNFSEGVTLDIDRSNSMQDENCNTITIPDPHLMDLTPEEERGVMAYMRAIPPNGL